MIVPAGSLGVFLADIELAALHAAGAVWATSWTALRICCA